MIVTSFAAVLIASAPQTVPNFDTHIVPLLTKAGCNAGACHGAASGRGGFQLSLFGSEPAADYESIVHAYEGRRVNPVNPETSLILAKPTLALDHGGDQVLEPGSAAAGRLATWIAAGSPRGSPRRMTAFTISADREVVRRDHPVTTLRVMARFEGGTEIDVTRWTVFTPSDPAAVRLAEGDKLVADLKRPGRHVIVARYLDRVEPIILTLPIGDESTDWKGEPTDNLIDEEVNSVLGVLRVPVSPQADDATYLRRVRLDLTGTLPAREEVESFLRDESPDKRGRLVDSLLRTDEFTDYWTLRLARTLQLQSQPNDKIAARTYANWLRSAVRDGMPLDRWARELITSTGDTHEVGPANLARTTADARKQAELVSRAFLGVRMECANCHNHPLDRWTQDDYHGLAAVFARLDRGRVITVNERGSVTNVRTGEPAVPRIPGVRDLLDEKDHRTAFADWLTTGDHPYFAKAMVNRIWSALFGRGLVEPVDDLRATNPATHPKLLDRLAGDFVQNGYDLRRTIRLIALSQAYGRSQDTRPGNETDDRYYSRARARPLDPEVLVDAIVTVTGVPESFDGKQLGTRAVTLVDPLAPAPSLDILGRCGRFTGCESGNATGGLPARLHLLNGELLNAKITAETGRLRRLLAAGRSDAEILTEFYQIGLGRSPTLGELEIWMRKVRADTADRRRDGLEDFVWALLNSREFVTNH